MRRMRRFAILRAGKLMCSSRPSPRRRCSCRRQRTTITLTGSSATKSGPTTAKWADVCYGQPSHLVFGDELRMRQRGVQQGDPMGPALLAMAIR